MPLRTILFLALFAVCVVGSLYTPLLGVLGYVAHYCIGPDRQWWEAPISHWGLRYSYMLAVATAIGMALHWRRLRFGKSILTRHEWLILLFLGVVWFSTLISPESERYTIVDHPSIKMTKVVVFVLMMSHVVTTEKRFDALLWTLIIGSLILGLQAYATPYSQFVRGRLEAVGGADFSEANFLAAFLCTMLPLIGVQFLRSGWLRRLPCLVSGVFTTNAVILARSRGALVGIAGGALTAVLFAPRKYRAKILVGMAIAFAGGIYLTDPAFRRRASTITTETEDMDLSARSRVELWKASGKMLEDNPLGVGPGNFFQTIGRYNPLYEGRDAHNTYVRCYTELGIPGIALFMALIANAALTLRRIRRTAETLPSPHREAITYLCFGISAGLGTLLTVAVPITLIYNEFLWWWLVFPVCLERVVANLQADLTIASVAVERPHASKARASIA